MKSTYSVLIGKNDGHSTCATITEYDQLGATKFTLEFSTMFNRAKDPNHELVKFQYTFNSKDEIENFLWLTKQLAQRNSL